MMPSAKVCKSHNEKFVFAQGQSTNTCIQHDTAPPTYGRGEQALYLQRVILLQQCMI
jgi:hypothetical protein